MPDPHAFVILGGTGDLAARKLLPALHAVDAPDQRIVGVGTTDHDDTSYRAWAADALREAGEPGDIEAWCERLEYLRIPRERFDLSGMADLVADEANRIFYLALPPHLFEDAIRAIHDAGLDRTDGWRRLVVEKPFGTDAASAAELDEAVKLCFSEEETFRIDHFLGKETVRNLLAFRFANPVFESVWNRDRVERVEITVAESGGVDHRGRYYDRAGVVRDMVQNHLTQILCLVAMEPPVRFEAEAIRDEKLKVLRAIEGVDAVTHGQYGAGPGGEVAYRDEEHIPDDSTTATFVEASFEIDNWRWKGVPFVVRTGKRLPETVSRVDIHFHAPPVQLFSDLDEDCDPDPNVLAITLQPDEGFDLSFDVKRPGNGMDIESRTLGFRYAEAYGPLPDAYETLVEDVLEGDQTLFVRADEVSESWRIWEPVADPDGPPEVYPAGEWPDR